MYLKKITKNNVTRLYYYESSYDPNTKKVKQKCIESLGTLEELKKTHNDPVDFYKKEALRLTKEKSAARSVSITIDMNKKLDTNENNQKNVGYLFLKEIYKQLKLDKFWKQVASKHNFEYDIEKIFRLLVFSRVLYPGSKKKTFEIKESYFETYEDFTLDDIYRALDVIAANQENLQKWIFNQSDKIFPRDMSVSYFDCTNYYFDIGKADIDKYDEDGNIIDKNGNPTNASYRKRGPEKNHRPDPIVEMGLMMDKNGIPLAYDLFPGNESEKKHMIPIINRIKHDFADTRTIYVADRGLNTSDNIYYINGDKNTDNSSVDGYLYGQSVRGADSTFKEWLLDQSDYIFTDVVVDEKTVSFKHKSRCVDKKLTINLPLDNAKGQKTKTVYVKQKQMVYYSEKYARKQKHDRDLMIARAMDMISNPRNYDRITSKGSASYVCNLNFDKKTGEIIADRNLALNTEKIAEEEKYDGYYSIVTSELEMSDLMMRDVYRGLSKIEDTFRVSKTDFKSRPIYVNTNDHIDAHFATCFTALVLMRLLEKKLNEKYPLGRILESLRNYNCTELENGTWMFIYYDEILEYCSELFGIELNSKYRTQEQMRRLLKY